MSNTSLLSGFEPIYLKLQAKYQATATEVMRQRTIVLDRAIDGIATPQINRIQANEAARHRTVSELEGSLNQLLAQTKDRWKGKRVRSGGNRLKESDFVPFLRPSAYSVSDTSKNPHIDRARKEIREALEGLSARIPWFESARFRRWSEEEARRIQACRSCESAIAYELGIFNAILEADAVELYQHVRGASAKSLVDKPAEQGTKKHALTQLAGTIGEGISASPKQVAKDHGRMVFQCGWMAHGALIGLNWNNTMDYGYPGFNPMYLPLLIDLVNDRGFLTDDETAVKSFLLRMLNTLPSGSVQLNVYDPKGMGDFVNYLFPLGEKQELILGKSGVASTIKQFQDLLEEVERHIGEINQKYLAGKYEDLVAYNQDAGVTFEPYRVLVINDEPGSWEKNYHSELVSQLRRVVDAGARCGVFVIVKSSEPYDLGLPMLQAGQAIVNKHVATGTTPVPAPKVFSGREIVNASSVRGYYSIYEHVTWVAPAPSTIDERGVTAIVSRLESELQNAGAIEVDTNGVAAISRIYQRVQSAKNVSFGPNVLDLHDTNGWWSRSSADGISAFVGVDSANQKKPRLVSFHETNEDFGALVGGKSGSGKTTFLHAMLSELVRRYSPAELELYLVDVKFGVEFGYYARAGLPHAKVIALESGSEFAVSVLGHLVAEVAKRFSLFKTVGVANLRDYKVKTKKPMPRILAVIDEFTGIFEQDNAVSQAAHQYLTRLIQQGRAAGVHLILASQSLQTASYLPKQVLQQIPQRVAFGMPDADSRIFLADDNPAATNLSRPGAGIFNHAGGRKDANEHFQGTFVTHAELHTLLVKMNAFAKSRNINRQPIILENPGSAAWTEVAKKSVAQGVSGLAIKLPIGLPLSLGAPVQVSMQQGVGGNSLVCVANQTALGNVISTFVLGGGIAGAVVMILDFSPQDDHLSNVSKASQGILRKYQNRQVEIVRGSNCYPKISQLKMLMDGALNQGKSITKPLVIVVTGTAFAHDLNQVSQASEEFQQLLEKGPAVGIHFVVAADSLATIKLRLGYSFGEPFSSFIAGECSVGDSMDLLQSSLANSLDNSNQVALYDRLTGKSFKVRPFKLTSFLK